METRGRARAGVWASERTAAGHGRLLELLAHLAVQAVVDAVDDVRQLRRANEEARLVLLDDVLLLLRHALDVVEVADRLVRAVGADLARRARVHPRELDVHAHVRVVDVDLLRAADVRQARVVDDRARGRGDREARGRAESGEELAARLGRDAHRARG